ncbi:GNAT family N-acetyltransferase [Streptomyces sp. NPDC047315]|uniref:GNAT family N-acetyltransferase n=1 Tax=Streptomyces sp. NPDC047315 TaxID=3155142 RepID=UPI0033DA0E71
MIEETSEQVALRVVADEEWPLWRDLRRTAVADAPHAFCSRVDDWDRGEEARWRAMSTGPDSYNLVADVNARPVGMARGVRLRTGTESAYELRSVWVAPEARGRGVADRLVAAVEEWALRQGARSLRLLVAPGNPSADALYRRHGYLPTGELGGPAPDGVGRQYAMAKDLRADRPAPEARPS